MNDTAMPIDPFDLFHFEMEAAETAERAREAPRKLPAVIPLPDPSEMPGEFARNTMLALRTQQHIMEMPMPDDDDPHYKAKLAAKASVSSAQIGAQLRSDENAVKMQIASKSIYEEIKEAIRDYKERELQLPAD